MVTYYVTINHNISSSFLYFLYYFFLIMVKLNSVNKFMKYDVKKGTANRKMLGNRDCILLINFFLLSNMYIIGISITSL